MLEKSNNDNVYLYIYKGKITQKVDADTGGAKSRTNKKGNVVNEINFKSVVGRLISFTFKNSEYGEQFSIGMQDGSEYFSIQIPVESSHFSTFVCRIDNVNFSEDIRIKSYDFEDKKTGKRKSGFVLYQNEDKIDPSINKDNIPKDYPEWKEGGTKNDVKYYYGLKTEWEVSFMKNKEWKFVPVAPGSTEANIKKSFVSQGSNIEFQDFDKDNLGDD